MSNAFFVPTVETLAFCDDDILDNFDLVSDGTTVTLMAALRLAQETRLLTSKGERAVRTRRESQHPALATGATAAIVWIGHHRVDRSRHLKPESVWPILVRAHAFGKMPLRDVLLPPEHAFFGRVHSSRSACLSTEKASSRRPGTTRPITTWG